MFSISEKTAGKSFRSLNLHGKFLPVRLISPQAMLELIVTRDEIRQAATLSGQPLVAQVKPIKATHVNALVSERLL